MAGQRIERRPAPRGQRVAGTHDQQQRLAVELLEGEIGHRRGLGQPPQHEVDLALAQLRHQLRVGAAHDPHAQCGMGGIQLRDRLGQQVGHHVRQCADGHQQLVGIGLVHGQAHALAQSAQRRHRVPHQHLGRGRELDAAATPQQQLTPHDLLELGDGLGDRRLRQRQGLGRAHQVALLRHGHQALQVAQLQA